MLFIYAFFTPVGTSYIEETISVNIDTLHLYGLMLHCRTYIEETIGSSSQVKIQFRPFFEKIVFLGVTIRYYFLKKFPFMYYLLL